MGVIDRVVSWATARPSVYVVEAPGGGAARLAVDRELDRRGWRAATSPSSADALLVAGPLPDALEPAVDLAWSQLPGPRARAVVADPAQVVGGLTSIQTVLRDRVEQRADSARRRHDETRAWLGADDMDHGDMDHGDMDHGDMDHGDMDMAPGGLALAEGADDRDGLEMDVLEHALGPVLDRWPGGLELRVTLHGDVVSAAEVRWWVPQGRADGDHACSEHADAWGAVATVLSLVGDERHARLARAEPTAHAGAEARLRTRLDRLARLGVLPREVHAALTRLLDREDRTELSDADLVDLVQGHDLGDVRLLVAAHAPRLLGADMPAGDVDD